MIYQMDENGHLTEEKTKCMINLLTVTHFEQTPSGHLAIHVMSGRVLVTDVSFDEFIEKQNNRSSILTPR
jgi:hypothetical protein